jgi:hypothetical protein
MRPQQHFPPGRLAHRGPTSTIAKAVPSVPTAISRSGPSLAFNHGNPSAGPSQRRRSPLRDIHTGLAHRRSHDQWKERPIGAREQKKGPGSDQGCPQVRIIPCVSKTDANSAAEPFDGQARSLFGRVPPKKCSDDCKIADGIEPKWCSNSSLATIRPPKAGPTARLTLTPTLFAATAGLSLLRNELWDDGLPDRSRQRCPTPMRNVNSKRLPGVAAPNQTMPANIAATAV